MSLLKERKEFVKELRKRHIDADEKVIMEMEDYRS